MELFINRVKYTCKFEDLKIVLSPQVKELSYVSKWENFEKRFDDKEELQAWAKKSGIESHSSISYEFTKNPETHFAIPIPNNFHWKCSWFLIGQGLNEQGWIVDFNPIGISLSAYKKIDNYNKEWDIFQRVDINLIYDDKNNQGECTFNFGSNNTLISKHEIQILKSDGNFKLIGSNNRIIKSIDDDLFFGRVIANREILNRYSIVLERIPINYCKRYNDLFFFYNNYLREKDFFGLKFISSGFDSLSAQKVSFDRNKMLFKNNNSDINPITGIRNFGVFKPAPNSADIKFIFIFQNNDDANTLYKYLKTGFKGFPGLERYVGIPIVLADSLNGTQQFKRLQFKSIESLLLDYKNFEKIELPEVDYENHFAIVISSLNKDKPQKEYYELKLSLLKKGIPSQFVNQNNIRKATVFNYHLPNIAIGIHAKLGGIPWRIDSQKRNELVIGFNQDFNSLRKRYIAGSVFFDNHGNLKRTFSFPEKESSIAIVQELRNAVNSFLEENKEIDRIVIHYHKSLSKDEKDSIDRLLKKEFFISVPYAVVEINDTKSRLELAFDPNFSFGMPISGSFVRLSKRDYLLFNNNRFKEIAPVGVKDELPLKIKIHFADESGFSHKELIEQVYEFSRLIWKGLKQRSQPATCYYAREIARFIANATTDIPENKITQTTPWVL